MTCSLARGTRSPTTLELLEFGVLETSPGPQGLISQWIGTRAGVLREHACARPHTHAGVRARGQAWASVGKRMGKRGRGQAWA